MPRYINTRIHSLLPPDTPECPHTCLIKREAKKDKEKKKWATPPLPSPQTPLDIFEKPKEKREKEEWQKYIQRTTRPPYIQTRSFSFSGRLLSRPRHSERLHRQCSYRVAPHYLPTRLLTFANTANGAPAHASPPEAAGNSNGHDKKKEGKGKKSTGEEGRGENPTSSSPQRLLYLFFPPFSLRGLPRASLSLHAFPLRKKK